jgi:ABC-type branched-subunit amino acid transport system ATPase component
MNLVFEYARRVIVMHEGKIIADGHPNDIKARDDIKRILLGGIYA